MSTGAHRFSTNKYELTQGGFGTENWYTFQMKYVNWDERPAVLLQDLAYAMVSPHGKWESVDFLDVQQTGRIMKKEEWEELFVSRFGTLDFQYPS